MQLTSQKTVPEDAAANVTAMAKRSPLIPDGRSNRLRDLIALIALGIVQWLWFGPVVSRVGFYLDDWLAYGNLFFSDQTAFKLIQTSLSDPRIVTRPIEAIVYAMSWLAFHDKVFCHHLLGCVFEVAAAYFLYLSLSRLFGSRQFAFLAATLLLIYPAHDATHYWVTANTISLSLAFYLASLWLAIKSIQERSRMTMLLSTGLFALSLLTYESFMPFLAITAICVLSECKQSNYSMSELRTAICFVAGLFAMAMAACVYQREILPMLGLGYHHRIDFSSQHAFTVLANGIAQTISPYAFGVFAQRTLDALTTFNLARLADLLAMIAIVGVTLTILSDRRTTLNRPFYMVGLGLLIVVISYAIFALAPEYVPSLTSIWSRLNTGASVGACLVLTGLIGALVNSTQHIPSKLMSANSALLLLSSPLLIFLVLADWGWAIPWTISWNCQKHIIQSIKSRAGHIASGDSVLLADTARYCMWSPVYDGVWDFQTMMRMYLHNKNIKGGVVSERMSLSTENIQDIALGYKCAAYPYSKLWVFIPQPEQWVKVKSAVQFIKLIRSNGMSFGLSQNAVSRWENEIGTSTITSPRR